MEKKPAFLPGLTLAEAFFREAVEPILESRFTGLRYSAALIGHGSEVFGFDNGMSTDHHWGPRVMLFLEHGDYETKRDLLKSRLGNELPFFYKGYPTNFTPPDPDDNGTQKMRFASTRPINHRVEIYTLTGYFSGYLGIKTDEPLLPADWLTLPFQKLRAITAGHVFHDDLGLEGERSRFKWYPHDIWLYIMAAGWARMGQEEHLMGRAGIVGDEIGSALLGSRLVRDIMRMVFFMEKEYPPYPKWFGTAFSQLKSAPRFSPILTEVLHSKTWQQRESHLCVAYEILAELHNGLGITEQIPSKAYQFFGRPFKIIGGERFTKALLHQIKDPEVLHLPLNSPIGSIDLFSDNSDLLQDPSFQGPLKKLYH